MTGTAAAVPGDGALHVGYAIVSSAGILEARIRLPARRDVLRCGLRWDDGRSDPLAGPLDLDLDVDVDVSNVQVLASLPVDEAVDVLKAALRCFARSAGDAADAPLSTMEITRWDADCGHLAERLNSSTVEPAPAPPRTDGGRGRLRERVEGASAGRV